MKWFITQDTRFKFLITESKLWQTNMPVQKNLHFNFRNCFRFPWWFLTLNISEFLNSYTPYFCSSKHNFCWTKHVAACRVVTMWPSRDRQIYQTVSKQRLSKHIPTKTNRPATIEVLLEAGFSTRSVPCWRKLRWPSQCTMEVCEERAWVLEAEESPLLEDIARERPVKTQQAGKGLMGAVVISGGAVFTCAYESCV
jgi:hypothetical protein